MRPLFFLAVAAATLIAADASARDCSFYGMSPAPIWQWQHSNGGAYYLKDQMNGSFLTAFNQAGFANMRLGIGKNRGDADYASAWPVYDQIVAESVANGTEMMANIGGDWDFADPNDESKGLPNTWINQMVGKFIGVANRYADTIKYYEITNEPNCCSRINPDVMAKLMAEIYVNANWIITHKDLHLIFGGLYGGTENDFAGYASEVYGQTGLWDWMSANKGRRYPWDAFGFHPYVDRASTLSGSAMNADIDMLQNVRSANGDKTPLWMTEFGWSTKANNIDGVWMDEATQAKNVDVAMTTLEGRSDVARTLIFEKTTGKVTVSFTRIGRANLRSPRIKNIPRVARRCVSARISSARATRSVVRACRASPGSARRPRTVASRPTRACRRTHRRPSKRRRRHRTARPTHPDARVPQRENRAIARSRGSRCRSRFSRSVADEGPDHVRIRSFSVLTIVRCRYTLPGDGKNIFTAKGDGRDRCLAIGSACKRNSNSLS